MSELTDQKLDPEFVRRGAVEVIGVIAESRRTVLDEHSHSFRWLTASLLALNGGAALAILSNETLTGSTKFSAGAFYLFGIVFALLVAAVGQRVNRKIIPNLNDQLGYWLAVSYDGQRVEGREQELNDEVKASMKFGLVGQLFGWSAGLLFFAGSVTVGLDLREDDVQATEGEVVKTSETSQ